MVTSLQVGMWIVPGLSDLWNRHCGDFPLGRYVDCSGLVRPVEQALW